ITEFRVQAPTFTAGEATLEVINNGQTPTDFNVLRLEHGKKLADVARWSRSGHGPPPATFVGGINGILAGASTLMTVSLRPGRYTAVAGFDRGDKTEVVSGEFTVS
ncbi:MAG TPA: hypothetical protein VF660_08805, partial [Actinomycetota bacterium]